MTRENELVSFDLDARTVTLRFAGLLEQSQRTLDHRMTRLGEVYFMQRQPKAGSERDRSRVRRTSRDPSRATEYRGFRVEPFEGTSVRPATYAGLGRGEMTGGHRKERGYLIRLPDGGTKLVPTIKRAREYIDNYMG